MKYPQLVSMPSAVSDWLEEQLDARGIDAVVYTRYVLSLLQHHHSQDDDVGDLEQQEIRQQLAKESSSGGKHPSGRSGSSNKRLRRSWFQHVVRVADVEQLRRSAVVEALMSAAEQKCGIESLVDELCEKLKHFESSSETTEINPPASNTLNRSVTSPTDLARRYYAAFPPLNCKSSSSKLITLIPQICTQNTSINSINSIQKRKYNRRTQHNYLNNSNRSASKEKTRKSELETMKSRSGGKQRLYLSNRNKKDFGFARSMEKSSERLDTSDWDMYFLNNRLGDEGYSTSDTTGVDESEDISEMEHDSLGNKKIDEAHLAKLVAKFDQKIEALWNTADEIEQNAENEYQDLPFNIQELLASPTKQTIELLNVANKHVTDKSSDKSTKAFIQCGTNITSSIWTECPDHDDDRSMYDSISYSNFYNEHLESYPERTLGDQFNSLSVTAEESDLYSIDKLRVAENETNILFENSETKRFFGKFNSSKNDFTSLPWEIAFPNSFNNKKWSDAENYNLIGEKFDCPIESNLKLNINRAVNESLITLNHSKEVSCFKEVVPKQALGLSSFSVNQQNESSNNVNNVQGQSDNQKEEVPNSANKEEEDLLTSTRTHFRPIKQENLDTSSNPSGQYADGTTFVIRSSLEHINYRRSESGTLYLESGFDTPKKYQEYRMKDVTDQINRCDTDTESCYSIEREFVLKFCVKQNEKFCQTELENDDQNQSDVESGSSQSHSPLEVPAKKRVLCDPEEFFFPGDEELLSDSVDGANCNCASRGRAKLATNLESLFNASAEACSLHGRDSTVAEINWPESVTSNWRKCDKCNNNWSNVWSKPNENNLNPTTVWGSNKKVDTCSVQSLQQIWSSSEELCRTCLGVPAGSGPPPGRSLEYFKLREELSEDGEQLLSDLSCLQRVYMEQLPASEISCDLNESIKNNALESSSMETVKAKQEVETQTMGFVPVAPIAAVAEGNKMTAKLVGLSSRNIGLFGNVIPGIGSKERKRRHSSSQRSCEPIATAVARNSWTNSSCLRPEIRCLFTPPLLRPVTL